MVLHNFGRLHTNEDLSDEDLHPEIPNEEEVRAANRTASGSQFQDMKTAHHFRDKMANAMWAHYLNRALVHEI